MNLPIAKKFYPTLVTIALTALSGVALAAATSTSPLASDPSARHPGNHPGNYYSQCHYECAPLNGGPFNNGTGSYDSCMSDCLKRRH